MEIPHLHEIPKRSRNRARHIVIAAIEARGRGKQDIADLRKDHDHLAAKVDAVKAEVKSNGDKIVQLAEGQGEIKGSLDTLLAFIKTDSAQLVV